MLFQARPGAGESLITLRVFATKFSHRQCPTSARASVRRLRSVVTSFEAPFFRCVGRNPCPASGIYFQELCNLFFRQILAIHMRIAFRNAPVVGKEHEVKVITLMVEDADSSVIAQLSLNQIAI